MQDRTSPVELLDCAVRAARAAGAHALANIARRGEIAAKTRHDVKLKLDLECQGVAEAVIRGSFPSHRILGEEGGSFHDEADPLWIIDPIDGTVNFMHGLPLWCSSVAVRCGREIVAGAVDVPVMKECFSATCDTPALCNGKPIRVSGVERLEDALVLTGLSKHLGKDSATVASFEAVSLKAQKTRLMGAAAVDICNVACGRADGYFESSIHLWDIAAAGLIVRQAGGRTETLEQIDDVTLRYLCTNGSIHDEMRALVTEALRSAGLLIP